jgi:uncharacterized protein YvpB
MVMVLVVSVAADRVATGWFLGTRQSQVQGQESDLHLVQPVVVTPGLYVIAPALALDLGLDATAPDTVALAESSDALGQKFRVAQTGLQTYTIQNLNSAAYIEDADPDIIQSPDLSPLNSRQVWAFEQAESGFFVANMATGHYLTVAGAGLTSAAFTGAADQVFLLQPTTIVPPGDYTVVGASGLVLALGGTGPDGQVALQFVEPDGTATHRWAFDQDAEGQVSLTNAAFGHALTVGDLPDPSVDQPDTDSTTEAWNFLPLGAGWFRLKSTAGVYLTYESDTLRLAMTSEADAAQPFQLSAESIPFRFIDPDGVWHYTRLTVPYISQLPEMPTGCEAASVAMLLQFAGLPVTKEDIAATMPYANDANQGFQGSPYGPYGGVIFPPALVELVTASVGSAIDLTGASWDTLQATIDSGRPVVVWIAPAWDLSHTVVLTGYSATTVWINDPLERANVPMDIKTFLGQWAGNANRALSY